MNKYWEATKVWSRRAWKFLWDDDSIWSWIANVAVAFLVIRFIVYPILGLVLGTGLPIVAVVSESMEHGVHSGTLCGQQLQEIKESFDTYWDICGKWYEDKGISQEQFKAFSFHNGFDTGDVIILWRARPDNLEVGDILVFKSDRPQPIIHRIVKITQEGGKYYYHTKGDHNSNSINDEVKISEDRILGKGIVRIPYLGWVKILFVEAVRPFGINIQR